MQVQRGEMQFFGMRLLPSTTIQHTITNHTVLRITNISLDASVSSAVINGTRAVLVMQLGTVMEDFAIATLSSNNPQATLDVNIPGPATVAFAIKGNVPVCVCGYQLVGDVALASNDVSSAEVENASAVQEEAVQQISAESSVGSDEGVVEEERVAVTKEADRETEELAKLKEETSKDQKEGFAKKKKHKKESKNVEQKEGNDGKKKISCKLCSKRFSDPAHLTAHVKNKHAFQHKQKIANLLGRTV
jgi:hypothetical protein